MLDSVDTHCGPYRYTPGMLAVPLKPASRTIVVHHIMNPEDQRIIPNRKAGIQRYKLGTVQHYL